MCTNARFWNYTNNSLIPQTSGINCITDYIVNNLNNSINQISSSTVTFAPTVTINCPQGVNFSNLPTLNIIKSFDNNSHLILNKFLAQVVLQAITNQQLGPLTQLLQTTSSRLNISIETLINNIFNQYLTLPILNQVLNNSYTIQNNKVIINSPISGAACQVDQNFLIRLFVYNLLNQVGESLPIPPLNPISSTLAEQRVGNCLQNNVLLENLLQRIKNIYNSILSHQISLQSGFTQIQNQLKNYQIYEIEPGIVSLTSTYSSQPLVVIVKKYRLCDSTRVIILNISLVPLDSNNYLVMHQRKGSILYRNNQLKMSDESLESL